MSNSTVKISFRMREGGNDAEARRRSLEDNGFLSTRVGGGGGGGVVVVVVVVEVLWRSCRFPSTSAFVEEEEDEGFPRVPRSFRVFFSSRRFLMAAVHSGVASGGGGYGESGGR